MGTVTGGLGRYDGRRFQVYDAASGLPGTGVHALAEDEQGMLIAGTAGGAARLTPQGFVTLQPGGHAARRGAKAVLPLPGGTILLGTTAGLVEWAGDDRPAPAFARPDAAKETEVTALARDETGTVWVGTTLGLTRLDRTQAPGLEPVPGLPPGRILALLARPGRPLLVSVEDRGVFEGTPGDFRSLGDASHTGGRVSSLLAERDDPDVLWLGTDRRGAFCRRDGGFQRFSTAEGLSDNRVRALHEDREGILWFGTESALTKRGPSAFVRFDETDGFPSDAPIFGMTESRDGALWFSAWDSGVLRLPRTGAARRFTARDGLPDARVVDAAAHPDGGVVIATRRGLARIEGDRARLLPLPSGISPDVRTLLVGADGRIVLGTRDGGLAVLHPDGRAESLATPVGNSITALYAAPDGTLWVGGEGGGAFGFKPGEPGGEHLTRESGLPSSQITSFLVDSRGTFWITTDLGAWRRGVDGRVRILDRRSGLPDSFLYWVGEDKQGSLWFGTNHGAARMDENGAVQVFTARDGLGSDECNEDGFFLDSRGEVFIGSLSASRYSGPARPRRLADPQVQVESVLAGGRVLEPGEAEDLPRTTPSLTFRFVAPSFTDEGGLRYRYRLLGLGEAWTNSEPGQGETTYGGLAPGSYRFEVLAVTADGRVSKEAAAFDFVIRPAWWQTRLALALGVLAWAAVIFLVVRAREAALVVARQRLEYEVRQRTEDLRKANERLADLAVTDELTGVSNRRRILDDTREAMAFARRRASAVSILLADLDAFKDVNDRLGHAAGDDVLRRAARAMAEALRTEDHLGRYGGDEFIAVLPGTGAEGAREAAERLRKAVAQEDFGLGRLGFAGRISISVGVAAFERDMAEPADLVRRADEALQRAKAGGRDRVGA